MHVALSGGASFSDNADAVEIQWLKPFTTRGERPDTTDSDGNSDYYHTRMFASMTRIFANLVLLLVLIHSHTSVKQCLV